MLKNGICLGLGLGMVIGALLMNNCSKVREIVDTAQTKVKEKMQKTEQIIAQNIKNKCEFAEDAITEIAEDISEDMM